MRIYTDALFVDLTKYRPIKSALELPEKVRVNFWNCCVKTKYDGYSDLSDRMTILKGRTPTEERPFNYDLVEMKKAMESGISTIPYSALVSIEAFDEWLEQF